MIEALQIQSQTLKGVDSTSLTKARKCKRNRGARDAESEAPTCSCSPLSTSCQLFWSLFWVRDTLEKFSL